MEKIDEIELFTGEDYKNKVSDLVKQVPSDYSEDMGFLRILYDVVSTRYRELEELEGDPSEDKLIKYGYFEKGPVNKFFFKDFKNLETINEKIKVEKYFWIRVLSDFYRDDLLERDKFQLQTDEYLRMLQDDTKTKVRNILATLQEEFDKQLADEKSQEKNLEKVAQKMMAVNQFDLDTIFLYSLRNLYKFSIITVTRGNRTTRLVRFPTLDMKIREGISYNLDDPLGGHEKALIEWHTETSSKKGINAYANSLLDSVKEFVEENIEFEKNMLDRRKYLLLYKKEVISVMEKSPENFTVLKALCVRHMTRKFERIIEALEGENKVKLPLAISLTLDKNKFTAGEFRPGMGNQIYAWKPTKALATILGISKEIKINDEADSPNSYIILTLESTFKRPASGVRKNTLYQPLKY